MSQAADRVGTTVGERFRLTAFLGEGAMASVYRAEQDDEPRDVAVKIMHPFLLRDETFAKRFAREAKAAARIEHPNSVRMLGYGEDGELLYLAMELLSGQDLFDVLAKERRLPEERAARIVMQMCGALGAAHSHGIVHRDLKPENVMIVPDPDQPGADLVKVLDFGIAKILERPARSEDDPPPSGGPRSTQPPLSSLTMVGTLVGTPEYMSPEQSVGQPVDARSDVYACGVLLFQLVTGKQPFTGPSPIEVMMAQSQKAPPLPRTLFPAIHAGLERVILKALAKVPAERQQTAAELAADLGALLPDLASSIEGAAAAPRGTSIAPAALPGVPSAVVIHRGDRDEAPETQRSKGEQEAAGELGVAAFSGNEPRADPASTPASAGTMEAARAELGRLEKERAEEDAKAEAAKEAAATSEREEGPAEVAAASPRPAPRKAPSAAPKPMVTSAKTDEAFAPTWALAAAAAVMILLIWLARYLRLG